MVALQKMDIGTERDANIKSVRLNGN